jgi:hypothetical protein
VGGFVVEDAIAATFGQVGTLVAHLLKNKLSIRLLSQNLHAKKMRFISGGYNNLISLVKTMTDSG